MTTKVKRNTINFKEKMVSIGVDIAFLIRTIGKFSLGVTGKIDHTLCGFEDQVRRGDCEWLKKWEAGVRTFSGCGDTLGGSRALLSPKPGCLIIIRPICQNAGLHKNQGGGRI